MDMTTFKALCKEMGIHLRAVQEIIRENELGSNILLIAHDDFLEITFLTEERNLSAFSFNDEEFQYGEYKNHAAPDGHPEAAKQIN